VFSIIQYCISAAANFISDSDLLAEQQREELSINVNTLLESNRNISRRLMNLEDTFDVHTILTKRQSVISTNDRVVPNESYKGPMSSAGAANEFTLSMSTMSLDQRDGLKSGFEFDADLESS
jgi:cell division control protein 24